MNFEVVGGSSVEFGIVGGCQSAC